jgi:hypothetical protein
MEILKDHSDILPSHMGKDIQLSTRYAYDMSIIG